MLERVLIAQPGRDRRAASSAPATSWGSRRSPSTRPPTARRSGCELADAAVCIGPHRRRESYLNVANVLGAAETTGCDAVHPGCGFLSENAGLRPRLRRAATSSFVGPSPEAMERDGRQEPRPSEADARGRRAAGARAPPAGCSGAGEARRGGRARRLPGAAEGRGRRRRARHAPGHRAGRPARTRSHRVRARPRRRSATAACTSRRPSSSARHVEMQVLADGRRRAGAAASATARSSAATRS